MELGETDEGHGGEIRDVFAIALGEEREDIVVRDRPRRRLADGHRDWR